MLQGSVTGQKLTIPTLPVSIPLPDFLTKPPGSEVLHDTRPVDEYNGIVVR